MKFTTYQHADDRRVLIGLITSKGLLARLTPYWQPPGLFSSRWANLLASLCFQHFRKYQMAPGSHINHLIATWGMSKGGQDEDTLSLLERFIGELNDQYLCTDEINVEVLVDVASRLFNKNKAKKLLAQLQDALDEDDIEAFDKLKAEYRSIDFGSTAVSDLFSDYDALERVFAEPEEPLIKLRGDLGRFLGGTLCRDAFVSFMGIEKRGKSIHLQELAYQLALQRRKVFLFQVGDMTEKQVYRRFAVRAANRPFRAGEEIQYPIKMSLNGKEADVTHEKRAWDTDLELSTVWERFGYIRKAKIRSEKPYLKVHCAAAGSMTVSKIELLCQEAAQDGFEVDAVIIDYADLLTTGHKAENRREMTNEIWTDLRGLSQKLHCLVLTATQADSASYDKTTLSMSNFSEDKRKLAHVTAMIGLNQTKDEKAKQVYRLNYIVLREGEFAPTRCCYVAACMGVYNPYVLSRI